MTLYIKNMVCVRCKMVVEAVLQKLNISYQTIELGWVKLKGDINAKQQQSLNKELQHYQLELMDNSRAIMVERIKTAIIEMLRNDSLETKLKLSVYLSERLGYDYTYLSNTFSEEEGYTIERFFIETRVDRVKELLVYEALTITEIFYRMNYSSVAHLCAQFKKVTGKTPSAFRKASKAKEFIWKKL
jgi:AraC family transcriptional regulator